MRPAWYDRITHRVWNGQQKYGTSTICPISLKAWSFLLFTGHKYWLPIFFLFTGFPFIIPHYRLPIIYFPSLATNYLFSLTGFPILISHFWEKLKFAIKTMSHELLLCPSCHDNLGICAKNVKIIIIRIKVDVKSFFLNTPSHPHRISSRTTFTDLFFRCVTSFVEPPLSPLVMFPPLIVGGIKPKKSCHRQKVL